MTREQKKVKEFMQTFGQETPRTPIIPDDNTRRLRVKLLIEEVLEFAQASGVTVVDTKTGSVLTKDGIALAAEKPADLVGVADGLADIDYVMQGAAIAYGLDLEPFCDEVHSSNMTKLWKSEEVAEALNKGYTVSQVGENQYLVKRQDGKVMKSPSYRPADLLKELACQMDNALVSMDRA